MKWSYDEPKKGDMVRVKSGNIYHYGIFVSPEEVIQFGTLNDIKMKVPDEKIRVCKKSALDFVGDTFLETAVLERKEKKCCFPAEKIVDNARSRIGEGGYNIIHNNCEHFAYECVFGKKYSSQTDGVRSLFKAFHNVDIYLAKIPEILRDEPLYCSKRNEEIESVLNERVKREKYYSWKLLEYALEKSFSLDVKNLEFSKDENGRWSIPKYNFSISHSNGIAMVACCFKNVGCDVEKIRDYNEKLSEKILTPDEFSTYEKLSPIEKKDYIFEMWTKKESIFKMQGKGIFIPGKLNTSDYATWTKKIASNGESFIISVSSNSIKSVNLYENIVL